MKVTANKDGYGKPVNPNYLFANQSEEDEENLHEAVSNLRHRKFEEANPSLPIYFANGSQPTEREYFCERVWQAWSEFQGWYEMSKSQIREIKKYPKTREIYLIISEAQAEEEQKDIDVPLMGHKTAKQLIADERKRQVEKEGWTIEHDDEHRWYELNKAADCYYNYAEDNDYSDKKTPIDWPFEKTSWKPKTQLFDYIRSGALYKAELERIERNGISGKALTDCRIGLRQCEIRIDTLLSTPLAPTKEAEESQFDKNRYYTKRLHDCPFCGGKAGEVLFMYRAEPDHYLVQCSYCSVSMKHDRADKAIGIWNHRILIENRS